MIKYWYFRIYNHSDKHFKPKKEFKDSVYSFHSIQFHFYDFIARLTNSLYVGKHVKVKLYFFHMSSLDNSPSTSSIWREFCIVEVASYYLINHLWRTNQTWWNISSSCNIFFLLDWWFYLVSNIIISHFFSSSLHSMSSYNIRCHCQI